MEESIINTVLPLPYPSKYAGKHNPSLVPESKLIAIVILELLQVALEKEEIRRKRTTKE